VGQNKVNRPLHEAVYAYPNAVNWIENMPPSNTIVKEAPILDGVGIWVENKVNPIKSTKTTEKLKKEILEEIEETKTEILVYR